MAVIAAFATSGSQGRKLPAECGQCAGAMRAEPCETHAILFACGTDESRTKVAPEGTWAGDVRNSFCVLVKSLARPYG